MKQILTRLQRLERDAPIGAATIPAGEYRLAEQVQCAWTDRFMAASTANTEMIEEARTRAAKYTPQLRRFDGPPLHAGLLSLSLYMQMTLSLLHDAPDWRRARELDGLLTDALAAYQQTTRDLYPLVERDLLSESLRSLAAPTQPYRSHGPIRSNKDHDELWRLLTEPNYVHPHLRTPPEPSPWRTTAPCPTTSPCPTTTTAGSSNTRTRR